MKILSIETSCDEAAVSLIEATGAFGPDFKFCVLGNGLASQAALHAEYGGVYPNLAKREHAKSLVPMLEKSLSQAGELRPYQGRSLVIPRTVLGKLLEREPKLYDKLSVFLERYSKPDVDVIAVTYGPGLEPALWVGINLAKALSKTWNVPIVAVNHMEGHIVLSLMNDDRFASFEFPLLSLLISGGHTELVLSDEFGKYKILGETRDDAVGEAFDKVARLLGLPYPGGPKISALAAEARAKDITAATAFTRPMLHDGYDFSFSGLKTAVRRIVEANSPLTDEMKMSIAREFENTAADVLITKTLRAAEEFGANSIVVGGGVSANTFIRAELARRLQDSAPGAQLLLPPPELATDNSIMIALAGYFHALKKEFTEPGTLVAKGNLRLGPPEPLAAEALENTA